MIAEWSALPRRLLPNRVKQLIKRTRFYVKHRSSSVNVYHCTITKAGSQWIRTILSDSRTYRYSGLSTYDYYKTLGGSDSRKVTDRTIAEPFPRNTIVTPLYIGFENFEEIPKPEEYKAFYVMRDPRDLIVSTYFSNKYSHPLLGPLPQIRQKLNKMSFTDGMLYVIQRKCDMGHYEALRSWIDLSNTDENVLLLRFEDLVAPSGPELFRELLLHCDIGMPERTVHQLLEEHSFKRLSGGRLPGEEDQSSHYRKGVQGDWKSYFNDTITANFKQVTDDLIVRLGYERDLNW